MKKLSQCEDVKESVPKQRKKAKCGAQAEGDAVDDKKPKVEAVCLEKEEWNTSVARDNGSDSGKECGILYGLGVEISIADPALFNSWTINWTLTRRFQKVRNIIFFDQYMRIVVV